MGLTNAQTHVSTRSMVIIIVFAAHNAFNCWMFLNFVNFKPAQQLLHVNEEEVGFITTVGWLGILLTLPIVTACTWYRTLLFIAVFGQSAPFFLLPPVL